MTNIILVHGTGVREESYLHSFERVKKQLMNRQDLAIHPCYWGALGAQLRYGGASVPRYKGPADDDQSRELALWGLLYEDPLYELRLLALRQSVGQPGLGPTPGMLLAQSAKDFGLNAQLAERLGRASLDKTFLEARTAVTGSRAFREALKNAPMALAEYRAAIAKAILAEALVRSKPENSLDELRIEAGLREEIVDLVIDLLGGGERGAFGWLRERAGGLLARVGTKYMNDHRSSLTDACAPKGGDILLYQARGERIRSLIARRLEEVEPPIVLLAHSLGGVACADLLIGKSLGVELLITVGSQVPFLYEIGALGSLEVGKELPKHFPAWLNIYDPRDFLSYVGAGVFPGRVEDIEVDNRQPFPAAHSSYWENPEVWTAICGALEN